VPPWLAHSVALIRWHDPLSWQQAPVGCGHGFGVQALPAPWKTPPCPAQALDESTLQTPLPKQQPPAPEGGVKVTVSFGRWAPPLAVSSRVLNRLAVRTLDSSPRTSQPWFVAGWSSQPWTSSRSVVEVQV
jgi:hypothetical protein